jgi:predicted nucleic acid-binding protein
VKFWDTSAIVPLLVIEPITGTAKSIITKDSSVVVWWGTRTECVSALNRQIRDGNLRNEDERQARRVLQQLADVWSEVQPNDLLHATAERLLAVHALRAADAFQLAAALHWCQRQPANRHLISFDTRLRDAAYKEGFTILPAHIG